MGIQEASLTKLSNAAPVPASVALNFEHDIVANEYGFYCVPRSFRGREVPEILAAGGVYEPATLSLMTRILRRGGDVISGGTFIGDFLPALSEALTDGALLHTFEPNPVARQAAQYTIGLNGLDNVVMNDCAVGDRPGELHLKVNKANGASMAARAKIVETASKGETISTRVKTLDSIVAPDRSVSLLHLDIEGHEWAALLGAQKIIASNMPHIIIEAEKPWKRRQFETELQKLYPAAGYRLAGCIERNAIYAPHAAARRNRKD